MESEDREMRGSSKAQNLGWRLEGLSHVTWRGGAPLEVQAHSSTIIGARKATKT